MTTDVARGGGGGRPRRPPPPPPPRAAPPPPPGPANGYRRARAACLSGRGYSVN
ncbi:hypothetical protein I5L42_31415 [Pseudomonas aeruginosa]|nr:hypothetical protein [Pseudomonas aeruginosa]